MMRVQCVRGVECCLHFVISDGSLDLLPGPDRDSHRHVPVPRWKRTTLDVSSVASVGRIARRLGVPRSQGHIRNSWIFVQNRLPIARGPPGNDARTRSASQGRTAALDFFSLFCASRTQGSSQACPILYLLQLFASGMFIAWGTGINFVHQIVTRQRIEPLSPRCDRHDSSEE